MAHYKEIVNTCLTNFVATLNMYEKQGYILVPGTFTITPIYADTSLPNVPEEAVYGQQSFIGIVCKMYADNEGDYINEK